MNTLLDITGTLVSVEYAAQITNMQKLVDNYSDMILGIHNADLLDQDQKNFIIEMLENQLNTELQSALLTA